MRTWLSSTLLGLTIALSSGCKEPDPNRFETHLEKLQSEGSRALGFGGLETLTKAIVTAPDNEERLREFAEKVIPAFEQLWDSAPESQQRMLEMLRDAAQPEGAPIWNRALVLDGSAQAKANTILALQGIRKAKAIGSVEAVATALKQLVANAKNDDGGEVRKLMAKTLGDLGDKRAGPALIKLLQETQEGSPAMIHRAAATALGQIQDAEAVEPLLTTIFSVADQVASDDVRERAKQALAAIGDPAVEPVLKMLNGQHEEIAKLAAAANVSQSDVAGTAALILGAIGSPKASDGLIAAFPTSDCTDAARAGKKPDNEHMALVGLRAMVARGMGQVADPKAVDALCTCTTSSRNWLDMFEIFRALGRIGGEKAVACLNDAVAHAEYSEDLVESDFKYRPRWDSARFAVLAATPAQMPTVSAAIAGNRDDRVAKELKAWAPGIELAQKCGTDQQCYLTVLRDVNANWFAREKAAFELARLADGQEQTAVDIAKAYKVRNPDARISMAWLSAHVMHEKRCPACAKALQGILDAEKLSTDKSYQEAVLAARASIAKLAGAESESEK